MGFRFSACLYEKARKRWNYPAIEGQPWTVVDEEGHAVRTHDGYARFTTEQQARWTAELANIGLSIGADEAKAAIRAALGIAEPDEDQ